MIVTSVKNRRGFSLEAVKRGASKNENDILYTYKAYVMDIIDGDSVPRKAAQEMRVGPSKSIYGNGFQSALSGFG